MLKILLLLEKAFFLAMFCFLTYFAVLTIMNQTTVCIENWRALSMMIVTDIIWAFILIASGSLLADVLTNKR